jgi:hypothetical protein
MSETDPRPSTYLSFNDATRQAIADDLEDLLGLTPIVRLVQETYLAMAPAAGRRQVPVFTVKSLSSITG